MRSHYGGYQHDKERGKGRGGLVMHHVCEMYFEILTVTHSKERKKTKVNIENVKNPTTTEKQQNTIEMQKERVHNRDLKCEREKMSEEKY